MTTLDKRLNAIRDDLADERLRDQVEATAYAKGEDARISAPISDLRRAPDPQSGIDTQYLRGQMVKIFEHGAEYAWVQGPDNYVGYIALKELAAPGSEPTHIVRVPRSFIYPGADLRLPRKSRSSIGSLVTVTGAAETRGTQYAVLEDGSAMIADHLRPVAEHEDDYVSIAETFIGSPYLWGGASGFGVDCSGIVQLSMRLCGTMVLRDTDMQEASIGTKIDASADLSALKRGDLVFWKGHVAIVSGEDEIIHASGHTMLVTRESLRGAVERIGYLYGGPTSFRRP